MENKQNKKCKPNKVGRHGLLSKELIEKAKKYIAAGNYACVACQYLGIGERTYFQWLQKAREDKDAGKIDTLYLQFEQAVKEGEAEAEMRNIHNIQKAAADKIIEVVDKKTGEIKEIKAQGSWQASAWYLERKHWKRWGVKTQSELAVAGNIKTEVIEGKLSKLPIDALLQIEKIIKSHEENIK